MTFYIKESHFLFLLNSQTLVSLPDLIIYHWLHHLQPSMQIVFHFISTLLSFGTRYHLKFYRSLNQLASGWLFAVSILTNLLYLWPRLLFFSCSLFLSVVWLFCHCFCSLLYLYVCLQRGAHLQAVPFVQPLSVTKIDNNII